MIQVVLFDLDQTLLDRTSSLKAFLNWQVNFFELVTIQQKPQFIQRFIELDNNGSVWKDQIYAQLIQEFQISSYSTQALLKNYIQDFNKFCRSFSDVDLVIYSLFKANFSLGLISNGKTPFQEDNFKALGLSEYFSSVIVSEAVGLRKPHPEIFQLACQQLGVIPQHCVFVGDHEIADIRGAKALGMKTILFDPQQKVTSTQADHRVKYFQDILNILKNKMKRLYKHGRVKFQVLFLFGVVSQFSVFAQAETDKQQPLAYELQVETKPKTYDPATQSRIRVYRKGATKTLIQHSFDCAGRKAGIRDYLSGNGALSALKAYARITFNIEEGMPRSAIQKEAESNAMRTYQLISYKEFILNADQPVNLYGFVFGATDSSRTKAQVFDQCVDAVASFRPQAGHDYEILGKYQNNQCQFQVFDLKTNQEVTVSDKLYACPEKSWKFWKRDQ